GTGLQSTGRPPRRGRNSLMSRFLLTSVALLDIALVCRPAWAADTKPAAWSQRFPEIAGRIPHFDQRMASNDFVVRQKVLTELTYFQPRDSKLYPPFLKALLKDPAPEIRRQAIEKLWEHNIFLSDQELPTTFEVHFIGTFDRTKPGQVAKLRKAAESAEAPGGWAIHNLGIIGDKE